MKRLTSVVLLHYMRAPTGGRVVAFLRFRDSSTAIRGKRELCHDHHPAHADEWRDPQTPARVDALLTLLLRGLEAPKKR